MLTGGPNTSPSCMITEPVASPMRTSGSRLSWPITSTMLSAMSIARDRVLGHEQHRVAEGLDHPAALGGDHVGAAGLEDLDQVADPVLVELVGQRGEADQVGEPDRDLGGVQVGVVGAERLDPGDRGREVPAPGVDQQLLERARRPARPAAARCRSGCRWPRRPPRAARPARTSVATCQSASRAIVCPTARVSRTAVSKSIAPLSTAPTIVLSATMSASVNAASSPASGKPSARHSRRACSRVTPAASATASLVSDGVLAQDGALELLAGEAGVSVPSSSRRSPRRRRRRCRRRRAGRGRGGWCTAGR